MTQTISEERRDKHYGEKRDRNTDTRLTERNRDRRKREKLRF